MMYMHRVFLIACNRKFGLYYSKKLTRNSISKKGLVTKVFDSIEFELLSAGQIWFETNLLLFKEYNKILPSKKIFKLKFTQFVSEVHSIRQSWHSHKYNKPNNGIS